MLSTRPQHWNFFYFFYFLLLPPPQTHLANKQTECSLVVCSDTMWLAWSLLEFSLCGRKPLPQKKSRNLRKFVVHSQLQSNSLFCKMSQFAFILIHHKGYFQFLWLSAYCFSSLGFFSCCWNITLRCAFIFWMITFHGEGHISWLTEHSFTCNLCAKHRHTMWNSVFPVCLCT